MRFRNHALLTKLALIILPKYHHVSAKNAYQEFISTQRDLPFGARYRYFVACLFGAGEDDLAIPLLLQLLNFLEASNELSVVQTVDVHNL
jgi:hypothetical protein